MKIALITGAAKNIGKEIAIHLKQCGWHIIIHYNNSQKEAAQLAAEINADLIKADLSKPDQIQDLLNNLSQPVDLLINNAAILAKDTFDETFERNFFNTITVNLLAPIKLSLGFMKKFDRGNIINIIDASLPELPFSFISYIISKQSLDAFTKLAKQNFAHKNIRVNSIAIGATTLKDHQSREIFQQIKSKYSSSVEDICQAIDFVLSNNTLNGETLDLTKWKSNR